MWPFHHSSQPCFRSTGVIKVSPLMSGIRHAGSRGTGEMASSPFQTATSPVASRQQGQGLSKISKPPIRPTVIAGHGRRRHLIPPNDPILWEPRSLLEYVDRSLDLTTSRIKDLIGEQRLSGSVFLELSEADASMIAYGDEALVCDIIAISRHLRSRMSVRTQEPRQPGTTDVYPELAPKFSACGSSPLFNGHPYMRHRAMGLTHGPAGAPPPEWDFGDGVNPSVAAGLSMLDDTVGYIPGDAGSSPVSERRGRYFFNGDADMGRREMPGNGDDLERFVAPSGDDGATGNVLVVSVENADGRTADGEGMDTEEGASSSDSDDASADEDAHDAEPDGVRRQRISHDVHGRMVRIDLDEDVRAFSSGYSSSSKRDRAALNTGGAAELEDLPLPLGTTDVDLDATAAAAHRRYSREAAHGRPGVSSPMIISSIHSPTMARPRLSALKANLVDNATLSPTQMNSAVSDWSVLSNDPGTPLTSWYEGSPFATRLAEIRRTPYSKLLPLPADSQGGVSQPRARGRSLSTNDMGLQHMVSSLQLGRNTHENAALGQVSASTPTEARGAIEAVDPQDAQLRGRRTRRSTFSSAHVSSSPRD